MDSLTIGYDIQVLGLTHGKGEAREMGIGSSNTPFHVSLRNCTVCQDLAWMTEYELGDQLFVNRIHDKDTKPGDSVSHSSESANRPLRKLCILPGDYSLRPSATVSIKMTMS